MNIEYIFGNSSSNSAISPDDFKMGMYNFDFLNYALNFKKQLESMDFQNKSFLEHFEFENFSTWWLIHERFFYSIQPIINFIILFESFLKKEKPKKIIIKSNFEYFEIIEKLCKRNQIPIEYNLISLKSFLIKSKSIQTMRKIIRKRRLKNLTIQRIEHHTSQFKKIYESVPNLNNKIIFATSVTYRRPIFNPKTSNFEQGEYLTKPLMDFFDPQDSIGLSIPYTTDHTFDSTFSERLKDNMIWIPEEIQLDNSSMIKEFIKKYINLLNNSEFQNLFSFNGINFWNYIKNMFFQMTFAPYLPYWLSLYCGYSKLFKSQKPKSIFMPSEIDPQNLILIFACNDNNIPTIGLQQGWFSHTGPPGYFQEKKLHSHEFSYPFPSKMFVWGNISKNLLIKLGWPESKIITFGHLYYNHLEHIDNLLETPPYSKFNLDSSKKIILFTTTEMQSKYEFPGYVYDTKLWKYLLETFSNLDDFIIILKPHPHEILDEYEQILKSFKPKNFFIIQDNLHELLSVSNLVVSNYSTVILDALTMKKPVIELRWPKIDENMSQFSSLVEHVKIENLKNEIFKKFENPNFAEQEWNETMNNIFSIPIDESKIDKLLKIHEP